MGAPTRGDIVLFSFPFTDLSSRKLRPCVVLSNAMGKDIVLCQMTSRFLAADAYCIALTDAGVTGGALLRESYIRANMLFTAELAQLGRKLCSLRPEVHKRVVLTIMRLLAGK